MHEISSNHINSNSSTSLALANGNPLGPEAWHQWLPVHENGARGAEPCCCVLHPAGDVAPWGLPGCAPPFQTVTSMQSKLKRVIVLALFFNLFCVQIVSVD
jgi:hypothetical protein